MTPAPRVQLRVWKRQARLLDLEPATQEISDYAALGIVLYGDCPECAKPMHRYPDGWWDCVRCEHRMQLIQAPTRQPQTRIGSPA